MKTKFIFPIFFLAILLMSVFAIYSCKKEKINVPPILSITSPADGASITIGAEVPVSVSATDADGEILGVNFYVDGISKTTITAAPYRYIWNTSGEENGPHVLKVTATDDDGLTASKEISIGLGNLPIVDFTSDKTNDTVPLTVTFTDLSTNEPNSWSWSFGDGNSSSEQNPSHTYADTGSFTVSLTSTNDYGSATQTKENYVIGGAVVKADFSVSDTNGLVPFTVNFTDQSSSNPTSWQWDFGDGETSSEQNPSHTYTVVGFYTVKLISTNAYGTDEEIKTNCIKGGALPEAEFSNSTSNGVAPLTVDFTDLSTHSPNSWLWDFGDGGTSTEQNPTYIYNNSGTFTVSFTVTNEYGDSAITKTDLITVGDFPTADFSASSTEGVAPLAVNFLNESSENSTAWLWDFGDGNSSTDENPTHTFTDAGDYDVSLTATNQYGSDTKLETECIHVLAVAPEVSVVDVAGESDWDYWVVGKDDYFYLDSENDIPQSLLFHSSEANKDFTSFFTSEGELDKLVVDDHIFVFKNFNGTKVDIGVLYPDAQTEILLDVETGYTWPALSLKSTNSSETWSDLIGTTANLIAGIPCMLTAIQAESTVGLASVILEWTCGNELLNLSINLDAQEIFLHNGSESFINLYDVNTTAISCGDSDLIACINDIAVAATQFTATQQALIVTKGDILEETETEMQLPIANFTANKTTGSAPVSITFTDLSTQNPSIWAWDFGDGETSSEQNPVHTFQEQGVFTVSLTVTNEYGTDEIVKNNYIILVNIPTANFTANKTAGAIPLTVTFTDLSTNNPNRWEWSFGDGANSISKNPTHIYAAAGNFTVTLKARNDYGSDTKTKTNYIKTGTAPVSAFSATPTTGTVPLTVNFTDQSTNSPTSWSWDFGDGNTSNLQNPSHTYAAAGSYTVKLIATNSYGSNAKTRTNYISVGNKPGANFVANRTTGTIPLTVSFTDQSTNIPTSWQWSFGDGGTSTTKNPSHTYSSSGTYTVSLTATNAYGSRTKTRINYITSASTPVVSLPTVTTAVVSSVSQTTATCGGNVTSDGGAAVTVRGVCWDISQNPTVSYNLTSDGIGTGTYISSLTNLTANTTYYVRAYAQNSEGVAYGDQKQFKTKNVEGLTGTFTDSRDGQTYATVKIGNQTWFAENLNYETSNSWWYNNSSANGDMYGRLYTWGAASTACPSGWHLPSNDEWTTLITYLGGIIDAGGKLKETGTTHWQLPNSRATNSSGFTALPGGYRYRMGENFADLRYNGGWWSSTETIHHEVFTVFLSYMGSTVWRTENHKDDGLSIRCVKD